MTVDTADANAELGALRAEIAALRQEIRNQTAVTLARIMFYLSMHAILLAALLCAIAAAVAPAFVR